MSDLNQFLARLDRLAAQLERLFPAPSTAPDWKNSVAFRWKVKQAVRVLQPVQNPHKIQLTDLQGIDEQKQLVERNTRQFVSDFPANNVLLTGARGTGKSSLVKAILNKYASKGLRMIEVEKHDLIDLPEIVDMVSHVAYKFVIFCDDLSFDADEPGYKALKVILDGSIAATSDNILIYATSNRRHLMPEYMSENLETKYLGDEIHPGETVEEKISLSERFGLWVSFYPFDQDEYLSIANYWLKALGADVGDAETVRQEALQWALLRGSRSGRVAWQFARDWAGSHKISRSGRTRGR